MTDYYKFMMVENNIKICYSFLGFMGRGMALTDCLLMDGFSWELSSSVQNASPDVSYRIMSPLPHKEEGMTNNSLEQQRRSKMQKLYAGIDISKDTHHVCVLLPDNNTQELKVKHETKKLREFVEHLKRLQEEYQAEVVIGLEAINGYASPLDKMLIDAGFRVLNINSARLYNFRRLYGAPFKNDPHDARLIATYIRSGEVLEHKNLKPAIEVKEIPPVHRKLRRLSRYRNELVREKVRVSNRLTKLLGEYAPLFLSLGPVSKNKALWKFLARYPYVSEWKSLSEGEIVDISFGDGYRIGRKRARKIKEVLEMVEVYEREDEEEIGMIVRDYAMRLLELSGKIKEVDEKIMEAGEESEVYMRLLEEPGISHGIASVIVGEIGTILRFDRESSFAAYNGSGVLDDQSGKKKNTKKIILYNRELKRAMRNWAYARMRCHEETKRYYLKKRKEGKTHLQALKCIERILSRKLYKLLRRLEMKSLTFTT
ncbi:IS110 family transposase [bacterium]|nr:MAG: IS110 family transposase [bacterium]